MAQKLNNLDQASSRAVIAKDRRELMKKSLRRAEEIRQSLKGRKHNDSTTLIAEDRKRGASTSDREFMLKDLLAGVTKKNRHSEVDFGRVGKEKL